MLGLVLAKEQKVSDLRQAWIDALREDVARIIAVASEIAFSPVVFGEDKEKDARIVALLEDANLRTYRIKLRINMAEPDSIELDRALNELKSQAQKTPHPPEAEMEAAEERLVAAAQKVMKLEWERVKAGEPWYRRMRILLTVFLTIAVTLLVAALFFPGREPTGAAEKSGNCTVSEYIYLGDQRRDQNSDLSPAACPRHVGDSERPKPGIGGSSESKSTPGP